MNHTSSIGFALEDGVFYAPWEFAEAMREEINERGRLTVAQAAVLCEKWANK